MREPIASTLDPLTEAQVNAYRRLPGSFGEMLQAAYNDGWNGCHAHMKGALIEADQQIDELKSIIEDSAQHDSWRCREYQECHCGLDEATDKAGLPRIPYPPKS